MTDLPNYEQLAADYYQRVITVFKNIKRCPSKSDNIEKLKQQLTVEDLLAVNVNTKHPRGVLEYARGVASRQVLDMLEDLLGEITQSKRIDVMNNSVLYHATKGNKYAIMEINYLFGDVFDINYTNTTGLNALKLAIIYKQPLSFISFLLSFDNINKTLGSDLSVYMTALSSDTLNYQLGKTDDTHIYTYIGDVIYRLINKYIPKEFVNIYFDKKQKTHLMKGNIYNMIEKKLVPFDISDYFEYCENPIEIAREQCKYLKGCLTDN